MKRAQIGDVFEVETPGGLGYLQYVNDHPRFGTLIWVASRRFPQRPGDWEWLSREDGWFTFFSIKAGLSHKLITLVASVPVPDFAAKFPTMLAAGLPTPEGQVLQWWAWDGQREWRLPALTDEDFKRSLRENISFPVLVDRIAGDWTTTQYIRMLIAPRPKRQAARSRTPEAGRVRHYLYFSAESSAKEVAAKIGGEDTSVECRPSAADDNWLVLVTMLAADADDIDEQRERLIPWVTRFAGEYDGWDYATD